MGIVYLGVSALELVFAYKENELGRRIVKPFICSTLIIGSLIFAPEYYSLIIGLGMCLIGDILFFFKKKKAFVALGTGIFLLGHMFYTNQILMITNARFNILSDNLLWLWILLYMVFGLAIFFYPVLKLSKKHVLFTILGMFYGTFLLAVTASSIYGVCLGLNPILLLAILGDICFIISDGHIAVGVFYRKTKHHEFRVMITYCAAQLLIVLAILLMKIM